MNRTDPGTLSRHTSPAATTGGWAAGTAGVVDQPSPFERVNELRRRFFTTDYTVEAERAVLVTEAYRAHESEPRVVRIALAFAHILGNCRIGIDDLELVVGNCAASAKACAVFPEFSYGWITDELHNHPFRERPHNRYAHTRETDEQLLGLAEYWKGKTVSERILKELSDDELEGSTHGGLGIYALESCINAGVGHLIPDYQTVYDLGWGGLRQRVNECLLALDLADPDNLGKRDFYRAQLIAVDASMDYCRRYAALARDMAATQGGARAGELLKIADNCEWVAAQPPRTFWEALQLGFFITTCALIESNGHSVAFGRFDQVMYPFFVRDLESGTATSDFVQELIESTMVKVCGYMKLRDWQTTQDNSGRGIGGLTLTIGGVDRAGRDATNALSYMVLDALAHTQIGQPWVMVRLHEGSPENFLHHAARVIRIGTGEPKFINDGVVIPGMLARGRDLPEARDYSVVGLAESDVGGQEYSWHDAAYFSLPKVLELALNDGRPLGSDSSGREGPATGSLADFASFEQLRTAFERQLSHWVERMVSSVNVIDLAHQALKPLPYLSLLIEDCTARGVDVSAGGARYNFTGVQAVGLGTVCDALAAIRYLVFDQRRITGRQFLDALAADWEGHDYLYALVNGRKVPHYGNDDDYADELASYVADLWCGQVTGRRNARGGVFQPGMFSVSSNVPFGRRQAASADGRKAGEPLSDGISPVHNALGGHDFKGITATINSAAKLDQEALSNGVPFNIRIKPSSLQGADAEANLVSLIRAYFRRGGSHLQISVSSREILLAADRNPEQYPGLLVYVAGYSTLWRELGDSLKRDIIARTELAFDENTDLTPPD